MQYQNNEHKLVSIKSKTNYTRCIYHLKGGSMKKCYIHYIGGDYICFQMSLSAAQFFVVLVTHWGTSLSITIPEYANEIIFIYGL